MIRKIMSVIFCKNIFTLTLPLLTITLLRAQTGHYCSPVSRRRHSAMARYRRLLFPITLSVRSEALAKADVSKGGLAPSVA